ncbi:MAG TPA: DUF4262 domain-containing protein [Verrucomicrobiae bacterium]|nr:DUF4262 domain-containing protein [Verrucomicrobiae bacterium]
MLQGFKLPTATDDSDRKLLSDIAQYGWHVLKILGDESGPEYCFSVGFYYSYGHPEILVMGLSTEVGHQLINLAGAQIASGKVFRAGDRVEGLVKGFVCDFITIDISQYKEYLGYGVWFYRQLKQPFPALQLVWPDKQGRFPWESGYDQKFLRLQCLLDKN